MRTYHDPTRSPFWGRVVQRIGELTVPNPRFISSSITPQTGFELPGGSPRIILVDMGSSLSLIQPGICSTLVKHTNVTPYGVTGDEL